MADDNSARTVLPIALEATVPLLMLDLARMTPDQRQQTIQSWGPPNADVVASRGDQIQFRTPRRHPTTGSCVHCGQPVTRVGRGPWSHDGGSVRCDPVKLAAYQRKTITPDGSTAKPHDDGGGTADGFNHLARGLAALAWCPGGVTAFGNHWCADHDLCEETAARVGVAAPKPALRFKQWIGGAS